MSQTTVKVQLQQRYDTSGNFTSANPTLLSGEIGWESDTKKYKIGDGSTAWTSLAYPSGAGGYTAGTGVSISASNVITASAIALTQVFTAANQTAHLALTTQEGDVVVRSDEKKTYMRNSGSASDMTDFTLLETPLDAVTSINGNTGAITADQLATAIESATDSNTFTDADHTKLNSLSTTPEGTAIISTGESGGTKFLREDGDGSCSWQSVDLSSKANLSGATFTGAISAPSALFTDDGSTAPVIAIRGDDAANWYGQINNDTYANSNTTGFRFYVADDGDAHFTHYGNAEYRDWSIGSNNGTTNVYDIYRTAAGAVYLYNSGNVKLQTTAAGISVTGSVTDSTGELRTIVQNTQAGAYTLVAADAGKHILASGNITWADSVFTAGQAITIVNNTGGDITITKGTNMYNIADASNANRTLGTRGVCTLLFTAADTCYISGSPLS